MSSQTGATSASQVRQKLLQSSLDCVKKCQVRYGGKTELATGEEEAVDELCKQIELVLIHGLKDKDGHLGLAVIRNVRDLVGGGEVGGRNLWNMLKNELNSTEQQRFMLLANINSDLGRGRAWIRASLNEQSLERFLQSLLRDRFKLENLYEEWAFMRDEERSQMLPSMAAGLISVRFAIRIDNPCLNGEPDAVPQVFTNSLSSLLPGLKSSSNTDSRSSIPEIAEGSSTTNQVISTSRVRSKVKKKRLKSAAQVVSFDESLIQSPEVAQEAVPSALTSPFSTLSGDDSFLFGQGEGEEINSDDLSIKSKALSDGEPKRNSSSISLVSSQSEHMSDQMQQLDLSFDSVSLDGRRKEEVEDEIDIYSQHHSSTLQDEPKDTQRPFVEALTPVTNKDVGALFPVNPSESSRLSMELDEPAEIDYAPNQEQNNLKPSVNSSNSDNVSCLSTASGESSRSNRSLGKDDLRKALLSVMEKKEELENQLKALRTSLENETSTNRDLRTEVENLNITSQEQVEKLESRNSILGRENELLKHQLKKYVGAVQKLRDGPQAYETLAKLESQNESKEINNKYVDYHYEASEYEKKLIQVAEMHGELLEFNEALQKSVQSRDQVINRLRAELVLLRGPLPEDQDNWDSSSLASSEISVGNSRVLVNIWIPSVFLTGTGSSRHHVYQVYVRIRDDEWNVYRRYNQFLQLHQQTKKSDPVVASFHFPPKKTVGNRSEHFVESRRKLLQTYLRNIVNYMVSTHSSLASCPDKDTLVSIIPFFSDAPPPDSNSSRPSLLGRRNRDQFSRLVL